MTQPAQEILDTWAVLEKLDSFGADDRSSAKQAYRTELNGKVCKVYHPTRITQNEDGEDVPAACYFDASHIDRYTAKGFTFDPKLEPEQVPAEGEGEAPIDPPADEVVIGANTPAPAGN